MIYCLGDYEIHTKTHELLYKKNPKKTEPLIFKLLLFMLNNPDRLLSRDELIRVVWKSRIISDSTLNSAISATRQAIGDSIKTQKYIKTLSGHGYRFIGKAIKLKSTSLPSLPEIPSLSFPAYEKKPDKTVTLIQMPDKPSIAVMNFTPITKSGKGELFGKILTMEINAHLARLPHFFVVASASSSRLEIFNLPPQTVAQQLGVRYLVYGNIIHDKKSLRVLVSLVDAIQNCEVWAQQYEKSQDDIFLIQNEISNSIIAMIDVSIEQSEIDRAFLLPSEDLSAWENYHRGFWHLGLTTSNDVNLAEYYFKRAITLDARFSRAYAGLSFLETSKIVLDLNHKKDQRYLDNALDHAHYCLSIESKEAMGYLSLGRAYMIAKRYPDALKIAKAGIRINNNYVYCQQLKAKIAALSSLDTVAKQSVITSHRLSPYDPHQFCLQSMYAISLIHQGKYETATNWSSRAAHDHKAFHITYVIAAFCHEIAGDSKQAQQFMQKALNTHPNYSIKRYQKLVAHTNDITNKRIVKALIKTGLPIG
ncbi:MAG: winged helix-turn-helix domain-containing protein [Cocleimonas sp.]|nr:winged helix-turn-helix domain-containing protein [Cocleimonas sp.]